MTSSELLIALVGTGLELSVLFILLVRRFYRQFPWFSVYLLASMLETAALFIFRFHSSLYFGLYWSAETATTVLIFLALQEIFRAVFRNFYSLNWFRFLFPSVGLLLAAASVLPAMTRGAAASSRLTRTILSLEIAIGFLQIGLFLVFFVLVRFFRVRWQQYPYGIAFGFGIFAAGTLSAFLLRSEFGTKFNVIYQLIVPLSYTLAVLVWLITFLFPQPGQPPQGKVLALTPEEMLAEIKQYSRTVKRVLKR